MALLKATDRETAYATALKAMIKARERCWAAFGDFLLADRDTSAADAADAAADAAFAAYTAAIKTLADAEDALSQVED